jgi:hypothetical protein
MNRRSVFALILTAVMLGACSGIPVPADKADYVGRWQGVGMDLTITADGSVDYKRVGGSGSVSVTAPIQKFVGDDFVVGVWFMTSRFKVNRSPYQERGVWKMVVEGVEVRRMLAPGRRSNDQEAREGAQSSGVRA